MKNYYILNNNYLFSTTATTDLDALIDAHNLLLKHNIVVGKINTFYKLLDDDLDKWFPAYHICMLSEKEEDKSFKEATRSKFRAEDSADFNIHQMDEYLLYSEDQYYSRLQSTMLITYNPFL